MLTRVARLAQPVALLIFSTTVSAGPLTVPNTFTSGTPAKAEEVNANFTAITNAVNANAQALTSLQTTVRSIPAGAQGPVGPKGPMGPQGPAGPADPGAMMVQDGAGKVVGSYFIAPYDPYAQPNGFTVAGSTPDEFVFIRTATRSFAVRVTSTQLGAQVAYNVSFASIDCTGPAYLTPQAYSVGSLLVAPLLPFAAVLGTTAYIGGTPLTNSSTVVYSYLSASGSTLVCSLWGSNGITGTFAPVAATFDLSTLGFVPPFSVH